MAPFQQATTFNSENCNMKFIPQEDEINNQIIVKLYREDEEFTWNFCADNEEKVMGKCHQSDVFMQLAGCEIDMWYKRFVYTDPEPQIIIQEMSQEEIDNHVNEYQQRQQEHPPNNVSRGLNTPESGCRTSTFHNTSTNDIVMTFE
jgi:hypothetical protein